MPIYPKNLVGTFDTYVRYQAKLANQFFEKAKTSAARHGIDFKHKILYGNDTVKLIINYAKYSKSNVIVIGSRGKGDPNARYLGSIANGILQSTKIPVLVVK